MLTPDIMPPKLRKWPLRPAFALSCWIAGCGVPTAPSDTALVGTVIRGPVQPVCRIDIPCDAPFGASFTVERGARVIAAFRSDSQGHFEVPLPSGAYVIVPGPDAPIMSPRAQAKEVSVGPRGTTTVVLHFDTGIR